MPACPVDLSGTARRTPLPIEIPPRGAAQEIGVAGLKALRHTPNSGPWDSHLKTLARSPGRVYVVDLEHPSPLSEDFYFYFYFLCFLHSSFD